MNKLLDKLLVDYLRKPEHFEVKGREKMLKLLYPDGMVEIRIKKKYPKLRVIN